MVKNTPRNLRRSGEYSYEMAEEMIDRSSHLLVARWSKDYHEAKDKEKYLFNQLHVLADYLDAAFDDYYLKNLYFQYVGGFTDGDTLDTAFEEMESIRLSIVRALKSQSKKVPPEIKTQHVYDGHKKVKWKFLIRLLSAQHTAELLYQQYKRQRKTNGRSVPERESITRTLPGMTAWYIRALLPRKNK